MGQCLKIIKVEDGGLAKIVNVWLDITKGRDYLAGSVVVLASASHLNLHGVNGYVPDLSQNEETLPNRETRKCTSYHYTQTPWGGGE
jgi:hypothetical protein